MNGPHLAVIVSFVLAAPVLLAAAYLCVLAFAARRERPTRVPGPPRMRFDVVVPAYDEEAGIGATLASLQAMDYSKELYRVLVVADNCTDATAQVARQAGAIVLERFDERRRGKGYAIDYALRRVSADATADAVVVVDADTVVSRNLLRAFEARFLGGATVLQAAYGVRGPHTTWRAQLMVVSLALFHVLRSLGRERLGLSVGLRGNGMAFTRSVLRHVPPRAFSIVEDVEYGLQLGEAGHRVGFVSEAEVLGDMAPRGHAAATQRRRWERGRAALAGAHAPRLLRAAWQQRDLMLLDLALDLVVPPLSTIVTIALLGGSVAVAAHLAAGVSAVAIAPWGAVLVLVGAYVGRGLQIAGLGFRGVMALLWAPVYIGWKLCLRMKGDEQREGGWVRTARDGSR